MRAQLFWIAIVATLALSACGGGGGGTPKPPPNNPGVPSSLTGLWDVTTTITEDDSDVYGVGTVLEANWSITHSGNTVTVRNLDTGVIIVANLSGSNFSHTEYTEIPYGDELIRLTETYAGSVNPTYTFIAGSIVMIVRDRDQNELGSIKGVWNAMRTQ